LRQPQLWNAASAVDLGVQSLKLGQVRGRLGAVEQAERDAGSGHDPLPYGCVAVAAALGIDVTTKLQF
jgi:hypothetical protein